jgi:hypothetical protein
VQLYKREMTLRLLHDAVGTPTQSNPIGVVSHSGTLVGARPRLTALCAGVLSRRL